MSEASLRQRTVPLRLSSDTDDLLLAGQGTGQASRVGGSALLGRKHAPDRRPLRFWQPFNDWWRAELEHLGRRPNSQEIECWYVQSADGVWGVAKPTLQETRVHAKCLRSLPLVRDYFRNYRAKKRGWKAAGADGDGHGDTDGGDDGSCRSTEQACKHARQDGVSLQAAMPTMVQTAPAEMMQMQAAGVALPQHIWAEAVAGIEGHDADEYTRAIMMQQHLQAAMLQQQVAAAAMTVHQFNQQQLDVFGIQDDDEEDEDSDPAEDDAAGYEHAATDIKIPNNVYPVAPVLPSNQLLTMKVSDPLASSTGQSLLCGVQPLPASHQNRQTPAATATQKPAALEPHESAVQLDSSVMVRQHPSSADSQVDMYEASPVQPLDQQQEQQQLLAAQWPGVHQPQRQPGQCAADETADVTVAAVTVVQHCGSLQVHTSALQLREVDATVMQQRLPHVSKQCSPVALEEPMVSAVSVMPTANPARSLDSKNPVCSTQAAEATADLLHAKTHVVDELQQDQDVSSCHLGKLAAVSAEACPPQTHQRTAPRQEEGIGLEGLALSAATQLQSQVQQSYQEVALLPVEQLLSMEQQMLVEHAKLLQEELYAKRELLKRSFEQLRRTQERLGRRERRLAKEQQKCHQYQQALTVWQAGLVPMTDVTTHQMYQAQVQLAMTAQAAAIQQVTTNALQQQEAQ